MAESNATQVILTDDGIKIIKAQNTADNAAGGVANLNSPNLMSVIEKQHNITQFAGLTSQYNVILQNAKDDGIDTTAVTAAYNNLNKFMASVLADPDHASDIDRVAYKKYQDAYNEELAKIQSALQNNANNKFTSAASATSQAASTASQAFIQAQSAVDYVNSETSVQSAAIGKAQSDASDAVAQASSAASDSKDAKQIAGAVSQSYKTLTDGSTMTIAELEGGLALKLTKSDLNDYATQTWTQNQIKMTADGINGTLSSVKTTVDSHDTSINELKADSSSFKAQFTTVNGTLSTQSTDISTLQASSKSLGANFDSLSSDNKTNQHNIGQLQASANTFSSTLTTVQTQVTDSAVGTNLITGTSLDEVSGKSYWFATYQISGGLQPETTYTLSGLGRVDQTAIDNQQHVFVVVHKSDWSWSTAWLNIDASLTTTYNKLTFTMPSGKQFSPTVDIYLSHPNNDSSKDSISGMGYISKLKLEKGSLSTDWCRNPADNATQSQITQLSGNIDLRVTKDDLISQINVQARNILISTSGQLTLSADTVLFDTDKPVIIPSANIDTALVNKKLTAADISANTFTTNNGTFTVYKDGSITAKNMTLTGGTLTSPTINASTINGGTLNMQTDGLINSPYTGIEQSADQFYHPWKLNTGQLTIGQGYITSVSSGTRSINGVPKQFDSLQGTLSASYLKFTNNYGARTYIDADMFTYSNQTNDTAIVAISASGIGVNMGTANAPALTISNGYIDASSSSSYGKFGAITLGYNPHTINSDDSLFFESGYGSGNPGINIWAKGFQSLSSRLSTKRQVRVLDDEHSNSLLLGADTATFQYNQDTNADNSNEGVIIDDVNTVKQYNLPDELITRDGKAPTDLMSFIARVISQNKYQARLIEDLQIRLRKVEIKNEQ